MYGPKFIIIRIIYYIYILIITNKTKTLIKIILIKN